MVDVVTCNINSDGQFVPVMVNKSAGRGLMFNFMLFAILVLLKEILY